MVLAEEPQPSLKFGIMIMQKNGTPLVFENITSVEVSEFSKSVRIRQRAGGVTTVRMADINKMAGVGEWEQPTA